MKILWKVTRAVPNNRLQPPLFIIGAPRSGTTFLVEVLNRHDHVLITNELRVMTFVNRVLNRTASDKWILLNGREQFLAHLHQELPAVIERYYRDLGASDQTRWGDKNPHYADSKTDPECLTLIDQLFPDSQFINLIRDGRAVVASLVNRGWVDIDEAIDVWKRHIDHAEQFLQSVGTARGITITYEDLIERPIPISHQLFDFIGLQRSGSVARFLQDQEVNRTPFSDPTSSLDTPDSSAFGLDDEQLALVQAELGGTLTRLGYMA